VAERCGVRPLAVQRSSEENQSFLTLSRKHAVEVDRPRAHLSIFGGKLTDCLNVGEEIAQAAQELGIALPFRGARWYGEPPDEDRDRFFLQARLMKLDELTVQGSSEKISTRLWRRYGASAFSLLEDIRQDPAMAEVLIRGTEYIRCELHHAAQREMVTKLEDFLRRRSKIALIGRKEEIARAPGLMEACRILFGEDARAKYEEYFAELAQRESLTPALGSTPPEEISHPA
jgi:glycerol-3-phosphate dehydrogenase